MFAEWANSNMTVWCPPQNIRVKAPGLHWRGDHLLIMEVKGDDGNIKGVRPLGGGLQFMEELDVEVTASSPPIVMESIYGHHGATGHEILFIADGTFLAEILRDSALTICALRLLEQ